MSFWKRQNYREQNISGCPGFRYSLRGLNRWFSLGGEMIVCYFNESYMTLWICENPYNFTAQEENLVWKFKKKTHRLFRKSVVPGWNGEWWNNLTVL